MKVDGAMKNICILLRRPPYGSVDAAEAVRHALGGAIEDDVQVTLILVDSGVNVARKGQDVSGSAYDNLGDGISDCLNMGVRVIADCASLEEAGLGSNDIHFGIEVAHGPEIGSIIKNANATMIF